MKKLDPNVENRKEKRKSRTGCDAMRTSRGTGCLWISSNAHDPPRLSLRKDQRPLREDLGQPLLPFVVVVYDRLDQLVNAYRSSSTRSWVTDLDIELNPGVDARFSRILSEQEVKNASQIYLERVRMGLGLLTSTLMWVAWRSATRLGRPS